MSSWRAVLSREYSATTLLICLAVLMHAADATMIATLVAPMTEEIGGVNLISWTVSLYEIGSIVAGAASGLLAMRHGLKSPLAAAAMLFSLGCLCSAIASTMWIVLLGRLLQGLGGGVMIALAMVATSTLFPRALVPQAMAVISMAWGSASFIGPLIGSVFVEYASWRYAFVAFAVMAALLSIWIMLGVDNKVPKQPADNERFPIYRLSLLCLGIVLIALAGVKVSLIITPLLALLGITTLIYFLRLDARHDQSRLLPINAISLNDPVGAGLTMVICFAIATIAMTVYGPYLLVRLHGESVLMAGYIVACSSIGWSAAAMAVSNLPERYEQRIIMTGMGILTLSIFGFVFSMSSGPIWLIVVFAILEGVGFGMAFTFILRRLADLADENDKERASAALSTMHRGGYAVGAAYIGILANASGLEGGDTEGLQAAAFWVFIGCLPFALIGLYAAFQFTRTSSNGRKDSDLG